MNLYDNTDNNINYQLIDLQLRKINDTIYDSIIKKPDGYYCRIVCGYKPYEDNHNYGENNVIHNGLYMIYPLPQHEIKEFKLKDFTPPKLLDGNSLITVDSFNSTNPSEFTVKVPIDRRYMAHKEYVEGKNILLKKREDRNHNKAIQIKEIYNDTNDFIGMQSGISLTNNKTETVTFYKENEDEAKLKLLSIEGNTVQSDSDLSNIISIGELQEDASWKIELNVNQSLHTLLWTNYQYDAQYKFWYCNCTRDSYYNGRITNASNKRIGIDSRYKDNKNWHQERFIDAQQTFNVSTLPANVEFSGIKLFGRDGWPATGDEREKELLLSEKELYSLLVDYQKTISLAATKTISIPTPLRAIKKYRDRLYLKGNKYFIDKKIESINIDDCVFINKQTRNQTLKFYIDTNINSIGSDVIACLPYDITCDSQDVKGICMSEEISGRIIVAIPLTELNNNTSDQNIKKYFNNKNPEILFIRRFARTIETDITSPILLDTASNQNHVFINSDVKGIIDLDIHYDDYSTVLTVSKNENYTEKLFEKIINLPRPLKPNEIYSWDNYRKHYVIKKNAIKEKYQNFLNMFSKTSPHLICWLDETSIDIDAKVWKDRSSNKNDFTLKGTFNKDNFTDKGIAFSYTKSNAAVSSNSFPLYEYQNKTGFTFEYYGMTQNAGNGGWKRFVQVGTDLDNKNCLVALLYNATPGNTPVKNIITTSVDHINKLIHLVITIEPMLIGNKVSWYVNGELFKQVVINSLPSTKQQLDKIYISQSESGTDISSQFVKTLRFYKAALSEIEIKNLYKNLTKENNAKNRTFKSTNLNSTNKLLIAKQLSDSYYIDWIKSDSKIENELTMQYVKGINTEGYFNVIDIPDGVSDYNIRTKQEEEYCIYNNFNDLNRIHANINSQNILVQDDSCLTYSFYAYTDSVFDVFIKGGNVLKIGYTHHTDYPKDGDTVSGLLDYTSHINDQGVLVRIDLNKMIPVRNSYKHIVINTNSINSVESNPCTELFIIEKGINFYNNIIYDEIEYLENANQIIEVDYQKIKDSEKQYTDTLIINDWIINADGEIEKKEDRQAYSALVICNPKDSFKIAGEIDTCLYVFLDENKEPVSLSNGVSNIEEEQQITTTNAPKGTQYCLFYLNTTGILKKQDIQLTLQSFNESSEIDNYIKMKGNPTLSLSAPYKKVRPLDKPTNIVAIDQKTSLVITWDEVLGAEEYVVYLEDQVLEIVRTNRLELFRELKGNISIKAINDLTQSLLSDTKYIHSVPRNPFIIYIDNVYKDNKYTFDVTFKDNSELETSYKLKYVIDDREEETVELPGYDGIGTLVKGSFTTIAIDSRVRVRVLAVNEQGENEVAPFIEMRIPPDITWAYKEDTKQLAISWLNTFPESHLYLLRYKLEDAEHVSTKTILNEYTANSRITTYIPLEKNQKMFISLAASVREDLPHIYSKPIECSAEKDVNLIAPTDFKSKKKENNQVEFSWIDNYGVEDGWELSVSLNNMDSQTIFIPSTSVESVGNRKTYLYTFPEFGFLEAKLRMRWALGVSRYTESITSYYFEVVNKPPSGITRKYINTNMIKFEWTAQNYVDKYVFSIKKKTDPDFKIIKTTAPELYFEDFEEVDYVYNIKTEFLGEITSAATKNFEFKPTVQINSNHMCVSNKYEQQYSFAEKTITKIADKYDVITRSIMQNTSTEYPINMYSITTFTMSKGLIAIETWGTGQRTEGLVNSQILTKQVRFTNEGLNVISYQETNTVAPVTTTVITLGTGSYKIEMEINKTRIVCIGDSITAGHPGFWAESMTGEITHQYPYWLDRRLKFQYEVINKGYGSDRTYNVLNRFQKDVLDLSPQYCLIQIGTNDIYWGAASADGSIEAFDSSTLADMKKNIMTMVDLCFQNNIVPILGMLIPRTQVVTDPVVKHGLYAFNDWIVEYANTTEGVNYVDFFNAGKDKIPPTPLEDPKSPGAMNPIYDGDNVYDEQGNLVKYGAGIHLNAAGYRIMAEAIPLNLFATIQNGVKMYLDEKCTIEANYNTEDKQNPFYEIEIEGMKLTRTKKIVRYIKNIGNSQVLFSIYPNDIYNLDYNFKLKETDEGAKTISGILTPGNSIAVRMELTPLTEDSKSSIELSLVSREFSIES